ncbi:MAG: hypothetical protein ACKO2P_00740 [Planctomycetota bacterium]
MLRQILVAAFVMAAACGTADAGDHFRLYHPGFVYAPSPYYVPVYPAPVVYAAPVVHYSAPVFHYPAPAVVHPVAVAPAPVYYSPWVAPAPVYYYGGYRGFRRYRGVEIEFERDGDIEIDYR